MRINLSKEEREHLRRIQRNVLGTCDYVCLTSVLMYSNGRSVENISEDLGVSPATVYRYIGQYVSGGIDSLLRHQKDGYWGKMDSFQLSRLRKELKTNLYTDAKSVSSWISQTFNIHYTAQGCVRLLNRIGFTYKKTSEVPCEADSEKQEAFMRELSRLLEKKDERTVVYYADGVHPTHNSRSTYAWIEKGEEFAQPTVSGRERVNINGLLNAYDVTDVIAHDCDSVNAQSTKALYVEALEKHPEASVIYIISDNARYYRNKELAGWVKGTKIVPLFLPPYSPNLNLIERLWKFLRKKGDKHRFLPNQGHLQESRHGLFGRIDKYKEELESLLTLNFRLYNSKTFSLA